MPKNSYDIRVVRLIKSTETNPLNSYIDQVRDAVSSFVCLGHFDIMTIEKLQIDNGRTPLTTVQEDSQRTWPTIGDACVHTDLYYNQAVENNYIYPLYAIKQLPNCPESKNGETHNNIDVMDAFWEIPTNYTVVTRLHCEREAQTGTETFSSVLKKRLRNSYALYKENDSGYLCLATKEKMPVSVAFYESLELGDIVGFIKCDSLATILHIQRCLYETPCVSDAYTYCGISTELFREGGEPNNKELLNNQPLEYISTRFSVKQANYAELVYPVLLGGEYKHSTQHFFVTGNVDAVIDWRNKSEQFLIELVGRLVHLDRYIENPKHKNIMYRAFNDIITRVGIKHCPPKNSREFDFVKENKYESIECPDIIKEIVANPCVMVRWKYPLIKLLGTLQTMSKNCVMDDLANLLIPGVNAILKRIAYHIQTYKQINEKELLSFLDQCTSFANDILHLENQLVQHPELMPVRYFVPAIVLGFEQKFIKECAYYIEQLDNLSTGKKRECRKFQPIIFPSQEKNTSTRCYFDHKTNRDYQEDTPLAIYVPVHNLYQPWEILHILCHEVAHYCGNELRGRRLRLQCIMNSMAEYALQLWDTYYHFKYSAEKKDVVGSMRTELTQAIQKEYWENSVSDNREYLVTIEQKLPMCVLKAASNRELQEEYQDKFLSKSSILDQLSYISNLDKMNSMYGGVSILEWSTKHLQLCIVSLYKECYADIMMILFLNCAFNDYYDCVYVQEYRRLAPDGFSGPVDSNNAVWWEHHTNRLAFVCMAIGNVPGYENWVKDTENLIDSRSGVWANTAKTKIKEWQERDSVSPVWPRKYIAKDQFNPFKICAYEAEQLLYYLSQCANKIENQVRQISEIQELRNTLKRLSAEQFDWNCLRDYLEHNTTHT